VTTITKRQADIRRNSREKTVGFRPTTALYWI
jgi:hypothetical protein